MVTWYLNLLPSEKNRECPLGEKMTDDYDVHRQTKSCSQTMLRSIVGGGMHSRHRREERKKICCKAIKYNSSCRSPCKERVIAMTHWCNPFETLWLWPRLL